MLRGPLQQARGYTEESLKPSSTAFPGAKKELREALALGLGSKAESRDPAPVHGCLCSK